MSCPLCGSQVTRYFHYSLKKQKEEGQFQFRISDNTLLLDFHVVSKNAEKPKKRNYDTITLGPVKDLDHFVDLVSYFPCLEGKDLGSHVSFDSHTDIAEIAEFKPKYGGLILQYNEKNDRVIFLDNPGDECFSLPRNIVQYNLVNALLDLQRGFSKASLPTESEINKFLSTHSESDH